jgi:predicted alpha/beta-fold hydrolase
MKPLAEFPRFRARFPWWGGDLQTLRNYMRGLKPVLDAGRSERLEFPTPDGTGDRLVAALDHPPSGMRPRPLVIVLHGLTGCEDSSYVRATAAHLLSLGHPVMRLNLRGAGPSWPLCRKQYHAGRSEDLASVLGQLDGWLAGRGVFVVGFSLGGNILLKYLGETGRRALLLGAVSISAPIDLKAAQRRLMAWRNRAYHQRFLMRMKTDIAAPLSDLDEAQRRELAAIRTVYALDERIVAPRNGFAGADDYYARCSAARVLGEIRVPTLVIHAGNDPWIPSTAYRAFDWASNPRLTLLMPRGGGHVGFHDRNLVAWHDRCIAAFFARLAK